MVASLRKLGDPLAQLNTLVPWEEFRELLSAVHEKECKSRASRKPFDVVLMFTLLILQTLYNLGDDQLEYQVRDRLSFARFLGLGQEDRIPDAAAACRFRQRLKELELVERLFKRFDDVLSAHDDLARGVGPSTRPSCPCRSSATLVRIRAMAGCKSAMSGVACALIAVRSRRAGLGLVAGIISLAASAYTDTTPDTKHTARGEV